MTRVGGTWLDTVDAKGHALHVARSHVLVPTPLTRLDLQRYFELAHRREAFSRAAAAAGRPEPPKDWRPSPRERILALHDSRWYPATIREIDDDVLRVRWRADDRISELSYDSVVPTPPYNREVHRGDFVLVRPTSMAAAWLPAQVDSVGADSIGVMNIDGEHRSVLPADVVPLRR